MNKNSRLKSILICIILIFNALIITCQVNEKFELANTYYSNGNLNATIKVYLEIYFFTDPNTQENLPYEIANLFLEKKDYKNALKYYDIQYNSLAPSSPIREDIRYQKIKVYIISGQYKQAKIEILQLNTANVIDKNKFHFYKGLIYYFNDEYAKGLKELNFLNYLNEESYIALNTNCKSLIKLSKKNSAAYQIASGIIPGLGQYLTGDIKSGLNSTILNGSLIYLFFSVGERLSYGDAIISVGPWLSRYFIGGVSNAKDSAQKKKNKKKANLIKETLYIISTAQHSIQ